MQYDKHTLLLHRAIRFAAMAHSGQTRKGTAIPYIVHPFEVAQILTSEGAGEPVVVAGLLHDTLEDTATTREDILCEFGESVLMLVLGASEDKSLPWEARKQHTIDALATAGREEQLLALADKLSNLRSLAADYAACGDTLWERFNRGFAQQRWYYRSLCDALHALADAASYREFCVLADAVFGPPEL